MRLVSQDGAPLDEEVLPEKGVSVEAVFPSRNVFGLSNSALKADALRACLPIPREARIVDWYVASSVWLAGGRLAFDSYIGMDYRQHPANMTRIRPPYSATDVVRDTDIVLSHLQGLLDTRSASAVPERLNAVRDYREEVRAFRRRVVADDQTLQWYLDEINALNETWFWWSHVAHPSCRDAWLHDISNTADLR
jgi:hypothetical protein